VTDPGFDSPVRRECRTCLVAGQAASQRLATVLERFHNCQLLQGRGRQRTDATPVLRASRAVNRVVGVTESMRQVLTSLAVVAPEWLRGYSRQEEVQRDGPRVHGARVPQAEPPRQAFAHPVGLDGSTLRDAMHAEEAPRWWREVPAVETWRRLGVQPCSRSQAGGQVRTAAAVLPPAARMIRSPDEVDAPSAKQDTTSGMGSKVHVTERCAQHPPRLITPVETTAGPVADADVTHPIPEPLQATALVPRLPMVAPGDLEAALLVTSHRDEGVEWLGPTSPESQWHAHAGRGCEASHLVIDWAPQQAVGPMGRRRHRWTPALDGDHNAVSKMQFAPRDGHACVSRLECPRAQRRPVPVRPEAPPRSWQAARPREQTAEDKAASAKHARSAGTSSQAVRALGVRRARSRGAATTHRQPVLTAAAMNFVRVGMWLAGDRPAKTRPSRFQTLMAPDAAAA
jgi:transposase